MDYASVASGIRAMVIKRGECVRTRFTAKKDHSVLEPKEGNCCLQSTLLFLFFSLNLYLC